MIRAPGQKLSIAAAFLCCALLPVAGYSAPKAVRAIYSGYMNGLAIGVISEQFEASDAGYRISSDTKPIGLAALVQRQPLRFASVGQLTRNGLLPSHFEAKRNPSDPPQLAADFDWAQGQVVLTRDGKAESHPITAGTQDRLSIMYQLMYLPLDKARSIEVSITNGRKVDRYRYRVTPDVELDTALGRLKTLHLVKQRDPGDTITEIWLSARHQQFPVKLLIVERDGMRYEQVIQSLELRD